jgi:hypothetical protein
VDEAGDRVFTPIIWADPGDGRAAIATTGSPAAAAGSSATAAERAVAAAEGAVAAAEGAVAAPAAILAAVLVAVLAAVDDHGVGGLLLLFAVVVVLGEQET